MSHFNLECGLSGLRYFRYDDQRPPVREHAGCLLRGIELINGPDAQEEEMRSSIGGHPRDLAESLSRKPTCLRLHFKDLRTKDVLEHEILVIGSQ